MSSGLPSAARVIATLASRTSGVLRAFGLRAARDGALGFLGARSRRPRPAIRPAGASRAGPAWRGRGASGLGGGAHGGHGGSSGCMGLKTRSHLRRRQAPASLDGFGALGKQRRASGACGVRCASTTVLPSRVGLKAHTASAPNAAAIFCQAALVAGRAAEQVDRHARRPRSAARGSRRRRPRCRAPAPRPRGRTGRPAAHRPCRASAGARISSAASASTTCSRASSAGSLNQPPAGRDHLRVELDRGGAACAAACGRTWSATPRPGPSCIAWRLATLAGSTNSSQAIMRCTYSSSISYGRVQRIEPWTHSVPRCR